MKNIKTLLYVEDDPDIRTVTEMALEDEDLDIILCSSGTEAIEKAPHCRPDLMLLDVMMPEIDGLTTLQRLKDFEHFATTPAIFMTACAEPADIKRYLSTGAIGVIQKPFDPLTLYEQLEVLVQQSSDKKQTSEQLTEQISNEETVPKAVPALERTKPIASLEAPTKQSRLAKVVPNKLMNIRTQFASGLDIRIGSIEKNIDDVMSHIQKFQETDGYRYIHSLAGSAATFGYKKLGDKAIEIEGLLKNLRDDPGNQHISETIQQCISELKNLSSESVSETQFKQFQLTPSHPSSQQRKLVYVLDNNPIVGSETKKQLRVFDYDVEHFTETQAIQTACETIWPDVFIIDIDSKGPDLAEKQFLQSIEAEGCLIPVIYTSTKNNWHERLTAVRKRGQAFFTKPINFDQLAEKLDYLVGQTHQIENRILIVDDTPLLSKHYASVLESVGFMTKTLNHPEHIFETLSEFRPNMLLIDLYLPECSGVELAQMIRQLDDYTQIPIVFLSTERSIQTHMATLNIGGGDDFLQKPISDEYLIAAVKNRLARFSQLTRLITCDSLTGLLNHFHLKLTLEREVLSATRRQSKLCCVMIDLDNFKAINDTFGHAAGDRVIKSLSRVLAHRLRKTDTAARYGGEEFAVVLPDTEATRALQIINGLRKAFSEFVFQADNTTFKATFSGGIAEFDGQTASVEITHESLLEAADKALYEAKHAGKNCILLATEKKKD